MFEDSLVNYLTENISKRKIMFFNLSLRNYCYDDEEEERYATHGSCAFMIPRVGKGYDMYYVNHHGEAMDGTLDYERVLTQMGIKNIPSSNQSISSCWTKLSMYMNTRLKETIYYDFTTRHNFYGINYKGKTFTGSVSSSLSLSTIH